MPKMACEIEMAVSPTASRHLSLGELYVDREFAAPVDDLGFSGANGGGFLDREYLSDEGAD
jgi:hypothetical protein